MKPRLWIDAQKKSPTFPIAIICSRFNQEIVQRLLDGAFSALTKREFPNDLVTVVWVPGAVEIPLTAQRLAQLGVYRAIVALGAVVQGETQHHLYVSEQVSQGCQRVSLENDVPVIFGVLTTPTEELALDRSGGSAGNRGADAIDAAIETVALLDEIVAVCGSGK